MKYVIFLFLVGAINIPFSLSKTGIYVLNTFVWGFAWGVATMMILVDYWGWK